MSDVEDKDALFSDFSDLTIDRPSTERNVPIYKWQSITDDFLSACKQLSLGELLHDDMFGLFEAMSAIELMDPKMDAGMQCNRLKGRNLDGDDQADGVIRGPLTFASALGTRFMPMENISMADQIAVVDATLACLVTWIEGHSLAQTVFINLYLHAPQQVTHPLLSSFSVLILKLVDLIKDLVSKAMVFEEEDFQPLVYGFSLCQTVNEQRCTSAVREVEDDLQKILRSTKPKPEEPAREPEVERLHEEAGALYARLRFVRLLYQGLAALDRHDVNEGQKFFSASKDQLANIMSTISLGTQPTEGNNVIGFEPLANQRLLPPTFPRYTEIRSRKSTVEYLTSVVDRIVAAVGIVHVASFHAALEFFMEFSAASPCILSRSLLQILYQPMAPAQLQGNSASFANGQAFRDILRDTCKSFIAPTVLTTKSPPLNSKQIRDCVDNFFGQCVRPMSLLVQTFGHNRARQRDKIPALLEEFALIQEEADKLDTMLNAILAQSSGSGSALGSVKPEPSNVLFFSTWLLYHVLRLMVRYILSGFELELFSIHEYPYLYWYLFELLYPWLTTCLHRADSHLSEFEFLMEAQRNAGKNKKKSKTSSKKKSRPFAREITCYQGYATLCAGYFKLIVGLKKDGKIMIPNSNFDNEAIRYDHRFAPFNSMLTPPSMPYSQFIEVYDHTARSESQFLYLAAARDFGRARQIFESILATPPPPGGSGLTHFDGGCGGGNSSGEISNLISITKNNLVASSVLAKDSSRKIDFEFSLHSSFPTVKLV